MEPLSRLDELIPQLTELLLADEGQEVSLHRVADLAVATIPNCDACGVSLATAGTVITNVASDEVAQRVDVFQYAEDEGPCLDALRIGVSFRIDEMQSEHRWPKFAPRAVEAGVVASLSLPFRVRGESVGALNLYSTSALFDAEAEQLARAFAEQAGLILYTALARAKTRELIINLQQALETRDVIGQAKGILMARNDLSADEAFDRLRRASQQSNEKLYEIAHRIASSTGHSRTPADAAATAGSATRDGTTGDGALHD